MEEFPQISLYLKRTTEIEYQLRIKTKVMHAKNQHILRMQQRKDMQQILTVVPNTEQIADVFGSIYDNSSQVGVKSDVSQLASGIQNKLVTTENASSARRQASGAITTHHIEGSQIDEEDEDVSTHDMLEEYMEHYEERLDHLEAQVSGLLKHIEKLHRTNIDLAA